MLPIGIQTPDFTLPDQNGIDRSLSDYRGVKVVRYFYPKDMTPGCTRQACGFGELYPQFREKGAVVLGVFLDDHRSGRCFVAPDFHGMTLEEAVACAQANTPPYGGSLD